MGSEVVLFVQQAAALAETVNRILTVSGSRKAKRIIETGEIAALSIQIEAALTVARGDAIADVVRHDVMALKSFSELIASQNLVDEVAEMAMQRLYILNEALLRNLAALQRKIQ